MDNECINQITGNKERFTSLDNSIKFGIKLGDDHLVDTLGKGTISVIKKQNETKEILDVYYVQGLKHNLLSVDHLSQNDYEVTFKGQTYTILDKPPRKKVIARIQTTKNRMFPLPMKNTNQLQSYAHNVTSSDETWL